MIRYHFDLYPDPEGALLVRFTQLQSAEYRGEANGTGAGRISIRATDPEAAFLDPMGLQYIRVVRDDGSTELVIGGFFTERGSYSILSGTSDKLLSIGGSGPLSYFQRAVMDADSWIDDPFIGTDPQPDGTWPLHMAGTGNSLGAILWRILHELEEPGRHQNPVPAMSLGFTHLLDSNGDAWVRETGDFVAQVSDSVYSVIKRLMELGLYVEVDPDTFEVRAYEPETHRRDRTGATFGPDVVRFEVGQNLQSDGTRELEARIRRNALLVGAADTWQWVTDPGVTTPWEGGYILDDEDGGSHEDAGNAQLGARRDAGDVFHFRMKVGDNETEGVYLPFEHIQLDDLVTVHTGTGQLDYDEQTFPVAVLTLTLRRGGDWDCWVDLGSTYTSMQERAFQAAPVKAHPHPPNPQLCRPGAPDIVVIDLDFDTLESVTDHEGNPADWPAVPARWNNSGTPNGPDGQPGVVSWGPVGTTGEGPLVPASPGVVYRWRIRVHNPTSGPFGDMVMIRFHKSDLTSVDMVLASGFPGGGVWTEITDDFTAPALTVAMQLVTSQSIGSVTSYDDVRVTLLGTGTAGDGHPDLVGTSPRAKRCDSSNHLWRTVDPTVNDDQSDGIPRGTFWTNTVSGAHFLLVDATPGVAEWVGLIGLSEAEVQDLIDASVPVTATDLTTYMEPHVDYDGHVIINGNGDPVMVEVAF